MKTLIYSTDSNLMYSSYKLIAVCDSKEIALKLVQSDLEKQAKANFKNDGYESWGQMFKDLIYSLTTIDQTQSLELNYVFEKISTNQLF